MFFEDNFLSLLFNLCLPALGIRAMPAFWDKLGKHPPFRTAVALDVWQLAVEETGVLELSVYSSVPVLHNSTLLRWAYAEPVFLSYQICQARVEHHNLKLFSGFLSSNL